MHDAASNQGPERSGLLSAATSVTGTIETRKFSFGAFRFHHPPLH